MNVPTDIVYAKLASMVKGAALADEMAAAEAIAKELTSAATGDDIAPVSPPDAKRQCK